MTPATEDASREGDVLGAGDGTQRAARSAARPDPARTLRVLVFSTVFPNPAQPLHGTFVFERTRALAQHADLRVIAPVAWYRQHRHHGADGRTQPPLPVEHPTFWYVPRIFAPLRGVCLAVSALPTIRRLRREFDFDLIDAHFAYPDGFAAILLGRWFRRPVCITLRGTIIMQSATTTGRRLADWAIRRAERIIAVSGNLATRAREGGVAGERIATIPNGVDSARFRPLDRAAARRQLSLVADGPLLLCVGHVSPRKGFHRVIRTLPRIIERYPDVRLAIVGGRGGESDNGAALRALTESLGLEDRIVFAGTQPPDLVATWFGAADLFVHASDFEGCPNVVMEAMACGRPIVATRVGETARMVPDFAGVLIDDPDDDAALAEAVSLALARTWIHEDIRAHVLMRSWNEVAREVLAEWQRAVDQVQSRMHPTATAAAGAAATLSRVRGNS